MATFAAAAQAVPAWRRDLRALLHLAVPLALTQLGEVAMRTTDVLMVGWLGTQTLAAAGLAMSVHMLAVLFGIGLASATSPLVAEALAAKRPRAVRRSVRQAFWAVVVVVVPVAAATCLLRPVLVALGQDPVLAGIAEGYLIASAPAVLFAALAVVLRGFITAFGEARIILIVTIVAIAANALCNSVLIFGLFGAPRLELVGAGLSTSLISILSFLALAVYAAYRAPYRRHRIFIRWWRPDWPLFKKVLRIGIPIACMVVLEVGLFTAAALLMGIIGTVALAAHQVVMQLASIAFMMPLGIGQAATVRVALAAGSGDYAAVRRIGWLASLLATAVMATAGLLFLAIPEILIAPFLADEENQIQLVTTAVSLLVIGAAFQILDGLQVIGSCLLRGLQDTLIPMWLGALGFWGVGFSTAAILGLFTPLAEQGVWIGIALGLAVAALLLHVRFSRVLTRKAEAVAFRC